jgi:hypothetical protein
LAVLQFFVIPVPWQCWLVAQTLFNAELLPGGCHVVLLEIGTDIGGIPDPPAPMPEVRVGHGGVAVLTRCEDDGKVQLEVLSGEPGETPPEWKVVFDGYLETESRGLSAGTAEASVFHIDASPGIYRIRAEARRDANGDVDAVRFIFPESPDLKGQALT